MPGKRIDGQLDALNGFKDPGAASLVKAGPIQADQSPVGGILQADDTG